MGRAALASALALAALGAAAPARAEPDLKLSLLYIGDLAAVSGGADARARYLGNLDVIADAELGRTRFHLDLLHNHGGRPNDAAQALQGIDNIEVASPGLRLLEAWAEHDLGRGASLRAGLIDLNNEFYSTDAAALLLNPSFGIGPEFAATGPRGPSIFPSTALSAQVNVKLGARGYVRVTAANAEAGTLGDEGGVDLSFAEGVVLVGEAGVPLPGGAMLALGAWTYTARRDDLFARDAAGAPLRRRTWGGYAMLEGRAWGSERRGARYFLRGGFAEGHTAPWRWAVQAGVRLAGVLPGRPDSDVSLGLAHGATDASWRAAQRLAGERPRGSETVAEFTLSDRIAPFLRLQPDLQVVLNPGARADAPPAVVAALRLVVEYPPPRD